MEEGGLRRSDSLQLFELPHRVVLLLPGVIQVPQSVCQVADGAVSLPPQVVTQRAVTQRRRQDVNKPSFCLAYF